MPTRGSCWQNYTLVIFARMMRRQLQSGRRRACRCLRRSFGVMRKNHAEVALIYSRRMIRRSVPMNCL